MSTLWTPDGERPVPPAGEETPAGPESGAEDARLTPDQEEQARQMAHELAAAREQLLEAGVAAVVTNHALGIYELAAIHLTADDPDFAETRLAIDALAALVEGLEGRLGDTEETLRDALHQIRMAFVQRSQQATEGSAEPS